MGERERSFGGATFNRSVHFEFRADRLTADAGASAVRLAIDRVVSGSAAARRLLRQRRAHRCAHGDSKQLRTLLMMQVLGYSRLSDATLLRDDPALRVALSGRRGPEAAEDRLPSQTTLSRFLRRLSDPGRMECLRDLLVEQAAASLRVEGSRPRAVTLDIDSAPIPAHGALGGSAYNGHYRMRCFHPLFVMLGKEGHLVAADLRAGNVSTNEGAVALLESTIARVRQSIAPVALIRGDSGFVSEPMLGKLEELGVKYVFRVNNNSALEREAAEFRRRPPGGRPALAREWCHEIRYEARTWTTPRRVIVVTQERPGDLYLHQFFLVTNSTSSARQVLETYRQRGTAEARLGEWKSSVPPSLSCTTRSRSEPTRQDLVAAAAANCAAFLVNALAYNLLHMLRRLAGRRRPRTGDGGISMARIRRLALNVSARVIKSARRLVFLLPRSAAPDVSHLFARLMPAAGAI